MSLEFSGQAISLSRGTKHIEFGIAVRPKLVCFEGRGGHPPFLKQAQSFLALFRSLTKNPCKVEHLCVGSGRIDLH